MIGKLTFSSPAQVLVMSLVWLAACVGIDYVYNPQLWGQTVTAAPASAPLSLHFHHLRCTNCLEEVKTALGTLPWLAGSSMEVRTSGEDNTVGNYAGWLDISVQQIDQIDFIALDQALRQAGYVASQIEFGGPLHYRLEGKARHLCSPEAKEGCEPLPDVGTIRRGDRLAWLDSMNTDATGSTVVFHVRYMQPNERIDVKELFAAMDNYGMYPSTLQVIDVPE
jgi:hypothetical protein